MNLHKKKYTSKFNLITLFILAIILTVWGTFFYNTAKKEVEHTFKTYAQTVALSLSNMIEEDSEQYKELLETYDTESEFYKDTYNAFSDLVNESEIAFAYTVDWYNEEEIKFIIDCVPPTDENSTPIGTVYEMGEYAKKAFDTKKPSDSGFEYYESWGDNFLSAFSPIIDPETGEVLSLVGVDVKIDELKANLDFVRYSAVATILFILIVVYTLLAKFSDLLIKPYVLDTLTGVYNRKFFNSYFEDTFNTHKKRKQPLSTLVVDIDHFKKVNDTYGHAFGDIVLKEMSSVIAKNITHKSCFARYGGEEFIISLDHAYENEAVVFAEKIRKIVQDIEIYNKELDKNIKISISIGVACSIEPNIEIESDLIAMSDKALYLAKTQRNCVRTYTEVKDSNFKIEDSKKDDLDTEIDFEI